MAALSGRRPGTKILTPNLSPEEMEQGRTLTPTLSQREREEEGAGITVAARISHSPGWVRLHDPAGDGSSQVPADRVAYYLAKGFRPLASAAGRGPSEAISPVCARCGFTAKDARGLAIHRARAHAAERGS